MLLAYLAEPPGRRHPRDALAALLWGDRQDEQARASLRAALSDLCRALGKDALVIDQDRVSLDADCVTTDCGSLRAAAATPQEVGGISEIYPGEFLLGIEHESEPFTDWLRERRAACRDAAILAAQQAAERQASAGLTRSALELMRACLSLEPLRAASHRAIMQLLAASGERAMALAQYRACRDLLRHELDTEPAPETVALADHIALDDATSEAELQSAASAAFAQPLPRHAPEAGASIVVLSFINISGDAEQGACSARPSRRLTSCSGPSSSASRARRAPGSDTTTRIGQACAAPRLRSALRYQHHRQ
jgi:DNA-binding SARP family transcriptional activator